MKKYDHLFSLILLLLVITLAFEPTGVILASPAFLDVLTVPRFHVDPPQTLTVIAIQDSWINSGLPGKNYGGCDTLKVGSQTGPAESWRALLRFDLADLPAGAQILSAQLRLVKVGGDPASQTVTAYRVTSPWVEGSGGCTGAASQSNWTQATVTQPWTTPGGDFDLTPEIGRASCRERV